MLDFCMHFCGQISNILEDYYKDADDYAEHLEKYVSFRNKQNKKINSEQVFVGRFITDEEYQQMMNNRRSDISILLEEVELEYEHFKELNNESKRNSER